MSQFTFSAIAVVSTPVSGSGTSGAETLETQQPEAITELALTGPSIASIALVVALLMLMLGLASLAIGRRVA